MELIGIEIQDSPLTPGCVRLIGSVVYDDLPGQPEEYWFDVPERYASSLSTTGNPWLVALLPLAVTLRQPLRLALPVDQKLLENVQELQRIWTCWYPHLSSVPVTAELAGPARSDRIGKTAAFFSGGVDSWFTLLWHSAERAEPKRIEIDELLCVWGFDVPLDNPGGFRQLHAVLKGVAGDLEKELVDVATNLRQTRWQHADWTFLSHGPALASVGLALEGCYSRVLIASSSGYSDLGPWGSHVVTDHLFSSAGTAFIHDGAAFSRVRKTQLVAQSDLALQSLRVCWKSRGQHNCCACEKCYRTMLALELFGALGNCSTFQEAKLDLASVERIYAPFALSSEYRDLLAGATQCGRLDIVAAIERILSRSARLDVWLKFLAMLDRKRLLWRLAGPLKSATLSRCVT
jgi:hypothetical protein